KEPAIVARQVVWVKMRSHPWWPAQYIDLSRQSSRTAKRARRGCFFV
ncbi:unnamed protein product, partial [Scytosiphon promiscuus]